MKLATLRDGSRDGTLVVVSRNLACCVPVPDIACNLQQALDNWQRLEPKLQSVSAALNAGPGAGQEQPGVQPFASAEALAPLPRAYQWIDGSAYVNHVELVRKARGAEMPASFWTDPLLYQGGSDSFLAAEDPILAADEAWGIDFEAEVAVITDDVPMGVSAAGAADHIKLLLLVNDVSLRNLIPGELAKGFGFFQSKPSSALSPVAVTPDELGLAWDGERVHLPLQAELNGTLVGAPEAGEDMVFDFPTLIAHAARTRPLGAGTLVGSGTVSNVDRSRGSCCLAEVRMLETIADGTPSTAFMAFGDRIRISMASRSGADIFGHIDQVVEQYPL